MSKQPERARIKSIGSTTISDVGSRWRLPNPVGVVLEYYDDGEVVALWPEANAAGFGKTVLDAVDKLKISIGVMRELLGQTPDGELSEPAKRHKRSLRVAIKPA